MRRDDDQIRPSATSSLPQAQIGSALEAPTEQSRNRMIHFGIMSSFLGLHKLQTASQMLAHALKARETRIAALMRDVESGHYRIKAEQVAEKLMQDYLLGLFNLSVADARIEPLWEGSRWEAHC
jgi:anti-sigma28 factor (negative regulator of flagellin synthesis)